MSESFGPRPTDQSESPRLPKNDSELVVAFNEFFEGWQRRGSSLPGSNAMLDTHPELVEIAKRAAVSTLQLPPVEVSRIAKSLAIPEPQRSPSQRSWQRNKWGAWKTGQLRTSIASTMVGYELTQKIGEDPRRYDPFHRTESSITTPEDVVRINALFARVPDYVQPSQKFLEGLSSTEQIKLFEDTVDLTAQAVRELQYQMSPRQTTLVDRLRSILPR